LFSDLPPEENKFSRVLPYYPLSSWQHESIILKALNPDYDDITIPLEASEDFRVVAVFVEVLSAEADVENS